MVAAWWWLRWELAAVGRTARNALRAPGPERDAMTQSLKAAGAAIAAWALTGWWLTAPLALLAPWTALALVDATVYRSFRAGLQQLAVIVVGTLWATAAMAMTDGNTMGSMLIALPALVLVGTYRRLGSQGIYGATTALFVITYGAYSLSAVSHRLLETAIGAVIGIAVNVLILPPIHLDNVRDQLLRLPRESADLLRTVAEGLRGGDWGDADAAGWHDRARRMERIPDAVAEARQWSAESVRLNPRWRLRRQVSPPPPPAADMTWERVAGHLTAITRTLTVTAGEQALLSAPGRQYLTRYAELAEHMAALCDAEAAALRNKHPRQQKAQRRARQEAQLDVQQDAQQNAQQQDTADIDPARTWELYDGLAADFHHQTGPASAVSGGLLVETKQLLNELTRREGWDDHRDNHRDDGEKEADDHG
ncbi:FUSC family protein [Streptomyces zagrosensis]|uniref:FUSC family protein n=1 Tax=Streptomyces zagrosensis TaxID=1042984 RepID=A0A7W9QC40_9ACTN|nr:FUSC family protein [Streptomyces zagrosensis]MBB5937400.1 hypothetical protein [Streptomyces zagrosensis]